ncbi:hypothetical protein U1Q18_022101 [Sarracenia purpurea var. burkii]
MELKQSTPSVIARLMGLDESPPKQPASKPHPVLSENYLRKIASIGLLEKRSYNESRSFEVNYEEGKEFINGVEVLVVKQGGKASSGTAEVKKSLVRPKFTIAKHLSMDEKLRYSKDFDELKEQDSGKDLPLSYYQQPDSFFTNHLFDLQFGQLQSPPGHVAVLRSSKSPYSRKREISRKSERTTVRRNILRSLQKLENGFDMDSWGDLGIDYSHRLSNSRLELKDKTCLSPSRIVVLKQNIGKTLNAAMTSFSPISEEGSQPFDRKNEEFLKSPYSNDWHLKLDEYGIQGKNESMKQNCSQKNSSESSGSRCSNEKAQTLSCMDSPMNHTVHCVQETCVILDELKNKFEKEGLSEERYVNHNLSSCSVPCSELEYESYDQIGKLSVVIRDELRNSCGKNDLSGNYEDNLVFPNSSISTVASSSLDSEVVAVAETETENVGTSFGTPEEQQSEPVACMLSVKDKNSSHIFDAPVGQCLTDVGPKDAGICIVHAVYFVFLLSIFLLDTESSIRSHKETLISLSCPVIDPEFPICQSESYSPTPNSVLEPNFNEEILSDTECSESVGADLHGLRMQLQLLKSETEETNSEGPEMAVSSDEDSGDGSVDYSEENRKFIGLFRAEESRDFSYIVDVLDEAGFQGGTKSFETWYSPEFPVNPSVFEMLEKKYGEQTYWEKSERRLLFDCVNLGLKEILLPCIDVLTRAKTSRKMFSVSQSREVIEDELWMFLVSQGKAMSNDLSEKALGTESRWCELQEDIAPIVCEIERFLFDELAAELLSIKSF